MVPVANTEALLIGVAEGDRGQGEGAARPLAGVAMPSATGVAVDAKVDLQTQRANTRIDIQSVPVDLTC